MAALGRALALLAQLPALAGAGALVAGEAALEQVSSECAAAMRVELLQRPHGAPAAAMLVDEHAGRASSNASRTSSNQGKSLALTKSTLALSSIHTGKSLAFKRFFFPVVSEQELIGTERDGFLRIVWDAIAKGAALPDESEYSADAFDEVSWHEACGRGARVRLRTVLGEARDDATELYGGGMSHFSFHGVYSEGYGVGYGSHREVDGLKVRQVERVFQEELGSLRDHSPWMEIHAGIYDNDLDSYVDRLSSHGVPVLALRWPAADDVLPSHFYSLIVHVPDTQEIFEIISATSPSDPRLVLTEFPMARHVFQQDELGLLMQSSGPTQVHISRTHYDLDVVKAHYEQFFNMKPVHEVRNADTGVSFVSFWHQSVYASSPGADANVIRTQVMYWNRPDQSMTVARTTEWLERRLEQLNSQYMRSYTSCWPIWGDNHYTVDQAPLSYFNFVRQKYDEAGIGYMLFRVGRYIFTAYFPLPGGMYLELQPLDGEVVAPADAADWTGHASRTGAIYCYRFTCPP